MKNLFLVIMVMFSTILFSQEKKQDIKSSKNLQEILKPIKANFNRLNSIKSWTKITKVETDDSTEGGYINFYYLDGNLEKILVRKFGESGQYLAEYYLINGQLSFLYEKDETYNLPLYWKGFDESKSKIALKRYYFNENKLVDLVSNLTQKKPLSNQVLQEYQKNILDEFNAILKLTN